MRRLAISVGAATAVFVCSTAAMAAPKNHDGFMLRLGPTFGPLSVTETPEVNGTEGAEVKASGFATGLELLLGGTPAPGLTVGGALLYSQTKDPTLEAGGREVEADGTLLILSTDVFVQYYFDPTQGFHVQGMLGYGVLDTVRSDGSSGGNDPAGLHLALGAGYDFWIADEWSVGPFLRVQFANYTAEEGPVKVTENFLFPTLGVSFTYH
ncbi:MAG: autotransporter outer membrane beta-barrel domain-containing protein [Polyangiaceae bacterium]